MSEIKGYKVFNPDWTCRGFQYEVGKTYKHEGNIEMCGKGFHFCRKASDCFYYYAFDSKNKVAEVRALGLVETQGDKSVTNEIEIVREIEWHELLDIVNDGKGCTGLCNSGNWNSGNCNSGNCNSGNCNSGNRNSGNRNSGGWNSGDWNSGNRNSGNRNSGDWNSGDWNSGDFCSGFFNSKETPLYVFNKKASVTRQEFATSKGVQVLNWAFENNWWIYSQNMSDEEKAAHPEHETMGGYLKVVSFKEACALMWDNLDDDEKTAIKEIPHFDAKVFNEITGVKV